MRKLPKWILRIIYIALFLSAFINSYSQNRDSLIKVIPRVKSQSERIQLMYLIFEDSGNKDPEKALYYFKQLLELSKKMGDKVCEAVATAELGYAIFMTGNSNAGIEMILRSVQLAEKTGSSQAIGIAYDNLAICYTEPEKQIIYLLKALAASTKAEDYTFVCFEYTNLTYVYSQLGKMDSAMYYNRRAIEVATARKVHTVIPTTLTQAGDLYYSSGKKPLALEYYRAALNEAYTFQDARNKVWVFGAFSKYYKAEGIRDSALHYARMSFESSKHAFYLIQMEPARLLWKLYEEIDNDSALKYSTLFYSIRDSVSSIQKTQQIQVQVIQEDARQQKLNEERNHNLQYAAIAFGLIVLIILFLVFSHSIVANPKLIRFLGIISLLIVFEFLNLLFHPYLGKLTHHSPVLMLLGMVCIAALLVPLHHKLEHWIGHQLVEKNTRIRLAAAKKTIASLEGQQQSAT